MAEDWQDYRPTLTMRCTQCGDTFTSDETHGCLSVEQMIEEMADGFIPIHIYQWDAEDEWRVEWYPPPEVGDKIVGTARTFGEAVSALYAAWRERE